MSPLNWFTEHVSSKCQQNFSAKSFKRSIRLSGGGSVCQTSPRRFLDLPTEIRLLIYEAIFTPASVVLQSGELPAMIAVLQNFPELISRGSRDVQLFRTCRTCHDEAIPIFYGSLNLLVYQHLPLLRLNFLPRIGPINASFIKTAIITPIGLPGEHQRLLESLGSKHGGLVKMEYLTLEIWDPNHIAALVSTCQELMQRHTKLKILFGRGIDLDGSPQAGDIPARLKLTKPGQLPGHRVSLSVYLRSQKHRPRPDQLILKQQERIIQSINVIEPSESESQVLDTCPRRDGFTSRGRRRISLAVPEPRRTIWSRYKFGRSRRSNL